MKFLVVSLLIYQRLVRLCGSQKAYRISKSFLWKFFLASAIAVNQQYTLCSDDCTHQQTLVINVTMLTLKVTTLSLKLITLTLKAKTLRLKVTTLRLKVITLTLKARTLRLKVTTLSLNVKAIAVDYSDSQLHRIQTICRAQQCCACIQTRTAIKVKVRSLMQQHCSFRAT
jgi:hypothetical protein